MFRYLNKLLIIMSSLLVINTINASDFHIMILMLLQFTMKNKQNDNLNKYEENNNTEQVTIKTNKWGGKLNSNINVNNMNPVKENELNKEKINNFVKHKSIANRFYFKKCEIISINNQLQCFTIHHYSSDKSIEYKYYKKIADILYPLQLETDKFTHTSYNIPDFITFQKKLLSS